MVASSQQGSNQKKLQQQHEGPAAEKSSTDVPSSGGVLYGEDRVEMVYPKMYLLWYGIFCLSLMIVYLLTLETERGSGSKWRQDLGVIVDRWLAEGEIARVTAAVLVTPEEQEAEDFFWRRMQGTVFVGVQVPLQVPQNPTSLSAPEQLAAARSVVDNTLAEVRTSLCEEANRRTYSTTTTGAASTSPCTLNFAVNYFSEFVTPESLEAEQQSKTFAKVGVRSLDNKNKHLRGPEHELARKLKQYSIRMGDDLMPLGLNAAASTSSSSVSPLQLLLALSPRLGGNMQDVGESSGCAWVAELTGTAIGAKLPPKAPDTTTLDFIPSRRDVAITAGSDQLVCLASTAAQIKRTLGSGLADAFKVVNFKKITTTFTTERSEGGENNIPIDDLTLGNGRVRAPSAGSSGYGALRNYKQRTLSTLKQFLWTSGRHEGVPVPQSLQVLVKDIVCKVFWAEVLPTLGEEEAEVAAVRFPPSARQSKEPIVLDVPSPHYCSIQKALLGAGSRSEDSLESWVPPKLIGLVNLLSSLTLETEVVTDAQVVALLRHAGLSTLDVEQRLWRQVSDDAVTLAKSPLLLPQAQMPWEQALATVAPLFLPMFIAVLADSIKLVVQQRRRR